MSPIATPLQIGGVPGGPELLIILALAVLLFGANKIPKLARSSGQAIAEFQRGRVEAEQELQEIREGSGDDATVGSSGGPGTDSGRETGAEMESTTSGTDSEREREPATESE